MTKRSKRLKLQHNYEQALKAIEETKPEKEDYTIFSEKGSQVGRIIYQPEDDMLTIEAGSTNTQIKGEYLCSIYQALQDLFSETEEER